MFEKFTDFDGKQFLNLWGGFSCECFVDGINTFVMFYIKDEEVLSLSGNTANDILDFVLSEYYENENSTIEDGFSTWLMGHYDNVIPTFDKNPQPILAPQSVPEATKEENVDNTNKVEPKFQNGQWIIRNEEGFKHNIYLIKEVKDCYVCEDLNGRKGTYTFNDVHKNFKKWDISDAKEGDILFQDLMDGKTFIYSGINPDKAILYSFIISNDGKDVAPYHIGKPNTGIGYIEENKNIIHPATKEQRDTLFAKMKEVGYDIGDIPCTTFDKEAEKEETLTTDDIPLPILYKTLLKDWKRQNRIIEKQKIEIKKLKDKVDKYSIKNYEMRKQLERYGVTTEKGENLHKIIVDLNRVVQKRNDKINKLQMRISELSSDV